MSKALVLGLSTLVIFGLGGYFLIEATQDKDFLAVLLSGESPALQTAIGAGYGLLCGVLALWIIRRPFFAREKQFYSEKIGYLKLNLPLIIFISLCAGVGEELFFRGGLQPLLGLWPTSVLFVFIHGYLNPRNWRISVYGAVMVFMIAGMGYLFQTVGLISAMTAHAALDLLLFLDLQKEKSGEHAASAE
jgi:hypothetical protein